MSEQFKPQLSRYIIDYAEFPGLQITAVGCSMGRLFELGKMQLPRLDTADDLHKIKVFKFFMSRIKEWTAVHPEIDVIDDDTDDFEICASCGLREGDPLPRTVQGLMCLESSMIKKLVIGYMQAVGGTADPKGKSTSSGDKIPEDLMNQLGNLQNPLALPVPS